MKDKSGDFCSVTLRDGWVLSSQLSVEARGGIVSEKFAEAVRPTTQRVLKGVTCSREVI